ncbi:hypothetical protein [Pseudonocardia sp. T1-2H]|uniref:hypothetical protein n=1 Tax=Pseudonocardia sp. T1-2H TaxID=3128899 RepID=UPI003101590E
MFIPGGTDHGVTNVGTTPVRLFSTVAADSFDQVEYLFAAEAHDASVVVRSPGGPLGYPPRRPQPPFRGRATDLAHDEDAPGAAS